MQVNTTRECYDITNAFIVPRLPDGKRATRKDLEGNPHLGGLPLAESGGDVEILALIGQDHSYLLTPFLYGFFPQEKSGISKSIRLTRN